MRLAANFSIPKWKQDFLDADLNYFRADLKYQLCEAVDKLKHNRTFIFKIVNLLRKMPMGTGATVDSATSALEALSNMTIIGYTIKHKEGSSRLDLTVNDNYFQLIDTVRTIPGMSMIQTEGRKSFLKKFETEMRKTYDSHAIISIG